MPNKPRLTGKARKATGLDQAVKAFHRAIGQRVRAARHKGQIGTIALGRAVGISQAQVSRLENGLEGFRTGTLFRIAHALKMEPEDLLP